MTKRKTRSNSGASPPPKATTTPADSPSTPPTQPTTTISTTRTVPTEATGGKRAAKVTEVGPSEDQQGDITKDGDAHDGGQAQGGVSSGDGGESPLAEPHTRARPNPLTVAKRLQERPDWTDIARERDRLIKKGRAEGLLRPDAQQRAYEELDRRYPVEPSGPPEPTPEPAGLTGLADIPGDWPDLVPNASLQAEVGWVQANRVRCVQGTTVLLSRALSSAPSHAALAWLETAVLFPSKWADVALRATQHQETEEGQVRRDRKSIEELRAILSEMAPHCPHCGELLA